VSAPTRRLPSTVIASCVCPGVSAAVAGAEKTASAIPKTALAAIFRGIADPMPLLASFVPPAIPSASPHRSARQRRKNVCGGVRCGLKH